MGTTMPAPGISLVALLLALLGGGLVAVLLVKRSRPKTTLDRVNDALVELLAEGILEKEPSRWERARKAVHARCAHAGFPRLRLDLFVGVSLITGAITGLIALQLMVAPVFGIVGALYGLSLPWLALGWQAARLRQTMDKLVVEFLELLTFSTAGTQSPVDAFMEVAATFKAQPLANHIAEARNAIDPRVGLGGERFATIIGRLARDISHPWFTMAYQVLVKAQEHSIPISEPLGYVTDFARDCYNGQLDAYSDLIQIRKQALLMYSMPFLITLAQQLTSSETVTAFYRTPLGMGVAVAETMCCVLLYRRIVKREQRLVDQAREGR